MDRLTALLRHFSLRTGVFYSGRLCGGQEFRDEDGACGHIHLIKRGPVRLVGARRTVVDVTAPSVLFIPRPEAHRLTADEHAGADVVCATVRFGSGGSSPVTDSLPDAVLVELAALPGAEALLDLMFGEAFADGCGRQAVLDRLCEVLVIRLVRHCIDNGLTRGGTLAGLADRRLARVLTAIQDDPARDWQLETMASLAGMSRARFAVRFREVTGETPGDYLAAWRMMMAQRLLQQGLPVKLVAFDVGYGSASALSRAFMRRLGCSPTQWMARTERSPTALEAATGG